MHRRLSVLSVVILVAATPAWTQETAPAAEQAKIAAPAAATPDFSGVWGRFSFPGLTAPQSGPGPVVNKSRRRQSVDDNGRPFRGPDVPLVSDNTQLVGDYTSPILKPQAAKAVKEHGEIELGGWPAPNPSNQCWPSGVPYVFWNMGMEMLQQRTRSPSSMSSITKSATFA
jgi:hypothetical protein